MTHLIKNAHIFMLAVSALQRFTPFRLPGQTHCALTGGRLHCRIWCWQCRGADVAVQLFFKKYCASVVNPFWITLTRNKCSPECYKLFFAHLIQSNVFCNHQIGVKEIQSHMKRCVCVYSVFDEFKNVSLEIIYTRRAQQTARTKS